MTTSRRESDGSRQESPSGAHNGMEDPPCARARGHNSAVAAHLVAAHALDAAASIDLCLPFEDDDRAHRAGILTRGASDAFLSDHPRPDSEQTHKELR